MIKTNRKSLLKMFFLVLPSYETHTLSTIQSSWVAYGVIYFTSLILLAFGRFCYTWCLTLLRAKLDGYSMCDYEERVKD